MPPWFSLCFRTFTQISTTGSDSAGEDLRQIVMKSYPYSFCLQKEQSIRQYCKIYIFLGGRGGNTRKLKKSLLTSRWKFPFYFPPKVLVGTILSWKGEVLDGFAHPLIVLMEMVSVLVNSSKHGKTVAILFSWV